jgi:predicted amidophosphoribosyltransferase
MNILAARKYKSLRQGQLSQAEAETRRLAYAIKDPSSPSIDFDTAAAEMARLIETPCWLVPVPASDGSTRANTILASLIASHRTGAQVAQALRRTRPIESQCARHRRNLPPTPPDAHHLKATIWSLGSRQVYLVDNVATSGNTMRAANAAMQRGAGLVFADAGRHTHAQGEPTLL